MRHRLRMVLAACVAAVALVGLEGPSSADSECGGRVFAVNATTGHLVQIRACAGRAPVFGPAAEVDSGDWRGYSAIFGVYSGDAAILYAVTPTGELWWRRQDAAGAPLSAAVRVADTVDWRHDVVFAAKAGYLEFGDYGLPVRTFRHDGWESGGTRVVEEEPLFSRFHGPRITTAVPESGYAIGFWDGMTYRVWRDAARPEHDDLWYPSGGTPDGVTGVTGDATALYGLGSGGDVVSLWQPRRGVCPLFSHEGWLVRARLAGHFDRVVVPVGADPSGPPVVRPLPTMNPNLARLCGGHVAWPWEWQ